VLDMLEAANAILGFAGPEDRDTFLRDQMVQSAVLYQLTVLGEAAKRISSDYRSAHAEIPWRDIAGQRDRLIHGYNEVNLVRVWEAVQQLPSLVARLSEIVRKEPE
jgi:uncharacterized protein with HEPN domain